VKIDPEDPEIVLVSTESLKKKLTQAKHNPPAGKHVRLSYDER